MNLFLPHMEIHSWSQFPVELIEFKAVMAVQFFKTHGALSRDFFQRRRRVYPLLPEYAQNTEETDNHDLPALFLARFLDPLLLGNVLAYRF